MGGPTSKLGDDDVDDCNDDDDDDNDDDNDDDDDDNDNGLDLMRKGAVSRLS